MKSAAPDAEVILFGATDAELGPLPFVARNLGPIDVSARAAILNEAHVLLDVSSSDGALPLEAAACGCAVVEPTQGSRAATPDELTEAVLRLLRDDDLRARVVERGLAAAAEATWERSGAQLERILRETCFVQLSSTT